MSSQLNKVPLRFGSLFAGIGGLDLGLERAGMQCAFQVEIADYPTQVLERHWPDVPRFRDIRDVKGADVPAVDVLCGGFPCQDISSSGKRAGISGERSGLWKEYLRLINELQPSYIIAENVAALLHRGRGFGVVLSDLAACGYDAEWQVLSARSLGFPHLRERCFVVAYSGSVRRRNVLRTEVFSGRNPPEFRERAPSEAPLFVEANRRFYPPLPSAIRMDDGLSAGLERLKGCGNAVVPQVAEFVGRCVVDFDAELSA